MQNYFRKFKALVILVLFSALFFVLGVMADRQYFNLVEKPLNNLNIINNEIVSGGEEIDMAPFWKVWSLLDEKYVATESDKATSTSQDRVWGAIQGLTATLGDPYTVFLPPADNKEFEADISGNFEGVGMEIGIKDQVLSVIAPLKGSPAEQAGIKAGDKIITIDDKPAVDLSTDEAVKLIRGPKGSTVKIGIVRDNKPHTFEIVRAVIDVPTVDTEIKGEVFVISLYNFYAPATAQFRTALAEFAKAKKSRLILDLRGNPGGYLSSAVDMASWFLPLGKAIVREDFNDGEAQNVYRSKGYDIFTDKLRMIILVDQGSASASEILAGALQEYGIAKLVGEKTYGKGSVQELVSVTDTTSLKVTVAKWLTPFGKSISEGGLTPDYVVKMTADDIKNDRDPQMDKVLELLK